MIPRFPALLLGLTVLSACAKNDLAEVPAPLGNFALGLNIVVADNMQKVPISRPATVDEWETALKKAVDDRFSRYQGGKLYNIGLNVDAFALAPPGIPVVASPKSVLVISANVWDDAAQKKLNDKPKRLIVLETASGQSALVGSGLTRTKAEQMAGLSYNAAKAVERWFLENPQWFEIPPEAAAAAIAVAPPPVTLPALDALPTAPVATPALPPITPPVATTAPPPVLLPAGVDVPLVK